MNNEDTIVDLIRMLLEDARHEDMGMRVRTYAEAGLLTSNKGLVLRTQDGSEFQVTIAQSK